MQTEEGTETASMAGSLWSVALAGALLTLAAPLVTGSLGVISCGAGAALAVVNLWVLVRVVRGFLAPRGARLPWVLLGTVKLLGLFAAVGLLARSGLVQILPLALGYAALPLGILLAQLRGDHPLEEQG